MRSKFDNGPIDEWYENAEKQARDYYTIYFKPYFSVMKTCTNYSSCGYKSVTPWTLMNNTNFNWYLSNDVSRFFFYLQDGQFVAVKTGSYSGCSQYNDDGTCARNELQYDQEPTIIIDVNGPKKPNIIGKDVFLLQFSNEKGVVPYCQTYTKAQVKANCKKGSSGYCCLKYLMSNSWSFKE